MYFFISPIFFHAQSAPHAFLLTNDTFLWICKLPLFSYQLMNIWVVSTVSFNIANNTVTNMHVQDFAWTHVFISHYSIPSSAIAGSQSNLFSEVTIPF